MVDKDICCVILSFGKRYEKISKVAYNSFTVFHPNINTFLITEENIKNYKCYKNDISFGILKYMLGYEVMVKHGYKKVIILGSDTITCDRLSEFIDNDEHDILATLDYPYQLCLKDFCTPDKETHLNADVVCFNNSDALLDIIKKSFSHDTYFEQGGLNEVVWKDKKYKTTIVDGPYASSNVIYNVRCKGNIIAKPYTKPWKPYTEKYYIKDNKLYSFDNKQIKVFHYCEGFGNLPKDQYLEIINLWITDFFNKETKEFFKNNCNAGTFFEEKYDY
jgi:hypothetical protein